MSRRLAAVLAVGLVLIVSVGVFAQEESVVGEAVDEGIPVMVDGPPGDPVPGSGEASGSESAPLSVGGYTTQSISVPCWAANDVGCKENYVLNVGSITAGRNQGVNVITPKNYFKSSGACPYGTSVGPVLRTKGLYLFVKNALANLTSSPGGAQVILTLDAWEFYESNCIAGTAKWHATDTATCTYGPSSPATTYDHVVASGPESCVSGDVDSTPCHMPDLFKTGSDESLAIRAFWVTVQGKVCNYDGTGCTIAVYETGCFLVEWSD